MRILSLTLGLVLVAQSAFCLGLEDMQEIALAKRETIKRFMVNLQKSEKDIAIARSGYLPSVDLSYRGNALDEASNLTSAYERDSLVTGAISWNVFNGFWSPKRKSKYGKIVKPL